MITKLNIVSISPHSPSFGKKGIPEGCENIVVSLFIIPN